MLKTLVKKQLMEIFRSYFYNAKTNKKRSKDAVVGYIVLFTFLMIVIIGGMFTVMSLALCVPLARVGMSWLYFAIMSLMAVFLGTFDHTAIFKVNSSLDKRGSLYGQTCHSAQQ